MIHLLPMNELVDYAHAHILGPEKWPLLYPELEHVILEFR